MRSAALHVVARAAAMAASAAVQREPVGLVVVAILSVALVAVALVALVVLRRLPAGDERRQAVDVAAAFRGRAALMTRLVLLGLLVLRMSCASRGR
jgi:hypothetical protein